MRALVDCRVAEALYILAKAVDPHIKHKIKIVPRRGFRNRL